MYFVLGLLESMHDRKRSSYYKKNMKIALEKIFCKQLSLRKASVLFNIPRSTLSDRMKKKKLLMEEDIVN